MLTILHTLDDHIIDVHYHSLPDEGLENLIHQPLVEVATTFFFPKGIALWQYNPRLDMKAVFF